MAVLCFSCLLIHFDQIYEQPHTFRQAEPAEAARGDDGDG